MLSWNASLRVEELDGRALPSGFGFGGLFSHLGPAVQADLAQLRTDTQQLRTDLTTLAPTLQADRQAIATAVQNAVQNNPDVQSAKDELQNDRQTWQTTLQTDRAAIASATDPTARKAAITQFRTDLSSAFQELKSDRAAVTDASKSAISSDPDVLAAKAQLQTDLAPIVADRAAIQADLTQLQTDLRAHA
jgi:chromosome segregation ATPase